VENKDSAVSVSKLSSSSSSSPELRLSLCSSDERLGLELLKSKCCSIQNLIAALKEDSYFYLINSYMS
jgi:hypothetical protein